MNYATPPPIHTTTMRTQAVRCILLLAIALAGPGGRAATYYSRQSGNWNNPSTWSTSSHTGGAAASYPGTAAGDIVIISRHTVTANVTPANAIASISLLQNGGAASAASMLNLNTAGITLTCNAFIFTDNNLDENMDLEVGSSAILQVNGAFTATRTTTNARNKRMRVYVRTNGRMNVTGNFTWTYNRAGGEGDNEVMLDNSGRIDVGGNLQCTIGNNNGGNNQFTWQMNNTALVNVSGSVLFSVLNTTDGDDMNLDLNGGTFTALGATTWRVASTATGQSWFIGTIDGAVFNAAGGLNLEHQSGDQFQVFLNTASTAAAASLTVTGNTTVTHTDGQHQTIELNNNATFSTSANASFTLTENDDYDQFIDIDGGTFSVAGNMTCLVNGTGDDHELNIDVDGTGMFSVSNDLTINTQQGGDLEIDLNDNAGTGAVFSVGRDFTIDKDNGSDGVYVYLYENSSLGVGRDFLCYDSPDNDDQFYVTLFDTPTLTVGRNWTMRMDDGDDDDDDLRLLQEGGTISVEGDYLLFADDGDDAYWDQDGGTATIDGNFTARNDGGDEIEVTIDGTAHLNIGGNMTIDLDNSDEAVLALNDNTGGNAVLNVGGNLVVDHEGSADDMQVLLNNGSVVNVGGDLQWDQTNSGGDYARLRMDDDADAVTIQGNMDLNLLTGTHANDDFDFDQQGGTFTVNGSATFLHAAGDDYYCHVHNSSVFDVGGNLVFNHTGGDDFKFDQSSNNSWVYVDGSVNMIDASGGGTPTEYEQDNHSNSKILGNFNITAGGGGQCVVDMNNQAYMELGGSFVRGAAPNRFGSLTSSNGTTIEYDGTANTQLLSQDAGDGGDGWDYENVVIDNSFSTYPQLTTVGTTTINQALTLTNGTIGTTATTLLVIPHSTTCNQGDANSFIDGPMIRYGSSNFTFPVGDNGAWARLRMESMNSANSGTGFTCEYFRQGAPNNDPAYYSVTIHHVSSMEHWDLTRTVDPGNNATSQVRLYWEDNTASGIVTSGLADLRVAPFSSTTNKWENHGGSATGGASGNIVSTTAVTDFNAITIGDRFGNNPLPVELLEFSAWPNGNVVDLAWATATENGNGHFEVERSGDGITFTPLVIVPGAGNSQEELHYAAIDAQPMRGVNFYRLKQVDLDGAYTYSEVVAVNFGSTETNDPVLFPNPGNGDLNVAINLGTDQDVTFEVVDMTGRTVLRERHIVAARSVIALRTAALPSGSYTVVLHNHGGTIGSNRWLKID